MNEELREQLESNVRSLKSQLSSSASSIGDWKVIKCYEAVLKNEELPYDINELMNQRQAVRDEINRIEALLSEA